MHIAASMELQLHMSADACVDHMEDDNAIDDKEKIVEWNPEKGDRHHFFC